MKPLDIKWSAGVLAIVVVAAFAACDSTPSAVEEAADTYSVERLVSALESDLQLSAVQLDGVQQATVMHAGGDAREPGYLWYLAGELSESLSREQIRAMLAHASEIANRMRQQGMAGPFGPFPEGFGSFGFHGIRPGLGELGAGPGFGLGPDGFPLRRVLTEEQWEALHALRLEFMEQIRALCQAVRTADDREAAIAELQSALADLQAAVEAWLDENLTPEQVAQLEELMQAREARRLANRETVRAAIDAVLGEGLGEQLQAIHDAFVAAVMAAREDHDGTAIREAAMIRDDAIRSILDDGQLLIYRIHQALQIRAHNLSGFGPGHRFGEGGPGGGSGLGGNGMHGG